MAHIAGNVNTKKIRRFPVVSEVCVQYAFEARIDGQMYPVRCKVRSISGFSAHADEHELEDWVRNFAGAGGAAAANGRPKTVFVVHGDPDAASAFADRIRGELGLEVQLPSYLQQVVLRP